MKKINICPSLLSEGYSTYSPVALKELFCGKKVSHILQYDSPSVSEDSKAEFLTNRIGLSISGVQTKAGIIQEGKTLRWSKQGEQSTHILKPVIRELLNGEDSCANEHLTMQIAKQVFSIETAPNALCFFKSDEPAYITKRFDIHPDGSKLKMEDFASIAGKSAEDGIDAKYKSSYEELAELIRSTIPSWRVEILKFFSVVLFNYIFSNGDAHLKNFSTIQTDLGDYKLAPAYDLMNTSLHIKDSTFALKKGLFKDKSISFVSRADFVEFGERIGCAPKAIERILKGFTSQESEAKINALIARSFLSEPMKRKYAESYAERIGFFSM